MNASRTTKKGAIPINTKPAMHRSPLFALLTAFVLLLIAGTTSAGTKAVRSANNGLQCIAGFVLIGIAPFLVVLDAFIFNSSRPQICMECNSGDYRLVCTCANPAE